MFSQRANLIYKRNAIAADLYLHRIHKPNSRFSQNWLSGFRCDRKKLLFPSMWITKPLNLHEACDWTSPMTSSHVVTAQRRKYLQTCLIISVMELVITGCYLRAYANEIYKLFGWSRRAAFILQSLLIRQNDDRQLKLACGTKIMR